MTDLVAAFDTEGAAEAAPDALVRLRTVLREAIDLQHRIDFLESDLKAAKAHLHSLRTSRIPDIMAEIQSDHFNFEGWDVKVEDIVSGSLPKDPEKRARAIRWLEENDAGSLLKTEIKLQFGKSQHNEALSLASELEHFDPDVSSGVHPQTLLAFARERLAEGRPLDADVLGLFVGKVAKFSRKDQK